MTTVCQVKLLSKFSLLNFTYGSESILEMATSSKGGPKAPDLSPDPDLLDVYHPNDRICEVVRTCPGPKIDTFKSFRPAPNTCLDYHISQTNTKLDGGPTKIRVTQTEATYEFRPEPPPAPRKKRPLSYFSGGPPCWKFVDEIWRSKQLELQKIYHVQFKARVAKRKKTERMQKMKAHQGVMSMVGPAWYQELSPNQIKTVDNLKSCIMKDLQLGILTNTKENIAQLGLVLRPNPKQIQKALKECCQCPVEFLLILYQIMNPNRRRYSINDRLLLSAVVHLTMTDTLRELHVRIPSPPPPQKVCKKKVGHKKKIKYSSPYLEPYTFVPEPRKYNGVYVNKHNQYPESCYFGYIEKFKKALLENKTIEATTEGATSEFREELIAAQSIYNRLVDYWPVRTLLLPSQYSPCYNFRNQRPPETLSSLAEESKEEIVTENLVYVVNEGDETSNEGEDCDAEKKDSCDEDVSLEEVPEVASDDLSSCGHVSQSSKPKCYQKPEPVKRKICNKDQNDPMLCHGCDAGEPNEATKAYHAKPQAKRTGIPCKKCKKKARKLIDKSPCPCDKCSEERRLKSFNYIVSGVKETDSGEQLKVIEGVRERKPCKCLEKYEKVIGEYEVYSKKRCKCEVESQKIIEEPPCPCEQCEEDRRVKNTNYIISGLKETEYEGPIAIVDGVSLKRPCKCLDKYQNKIKEYEAYSKRIEAIKKLKEQDNKYIIGGVVNSRDGPHYLISGIRPPIDCKCAKEMRAELEEQRRIANMPHIPPGRIKYGICGVKETPQGSVYILNQAVPIEDCECMSIYKKFETKHAGCMKLFEDYIKLMNLEVECFTNEFNENTECDPCSGDNDVGSTDDSLGDEEVRCGDHVVNEEGSQTDDATEMVCAETECHDDAEELACTDEPTDPEENQSPCAKPKKRKSCKCKKNKLRKKLPSCRQPPPCSCPPSPPPCSCPPPEPEPEECVDCTCGPPPVEEVIEEVVEVEPVVVPQPIKRFFIYNKILCNRMWQLKVLKKALASMADDGYPLAKLPDCHKLPHMKLWMELRCGTFWTQQDKYLWTMKSKTLWRHTDVCYNKVHTPSLPITKEKADELTWRDAAYVRKMASDSVSMYFRKVRQTNVNIGREFLPTMFVYEFPFSTFRDCYFSYTPSKEEDVLCAFTWAPFEVKNFSKRKSCIC